MLHVSLQNHQLAPANFHVTSICNGVQRDREGKETRTVILDKIVRDSSVLHVLVIRKPSLLYSIVVNSPGVTGHTQDVRVYHLARTSTIASYAGQFITCILGGRRCTVHACALPLQE